MPLNEQTQMDVGERLWNAYEQCRIAWETPEPKQDGSLNYALTNVWPTIVTSYSGVEQAIKLLIALRKGVTVEKLVRPPRESGNRCRPFESHNLAELFDRLNAEEKRAIGRAGTQGPSPPRSGRPRTRPEGGCVALTTATRQRCRDPDVNAGI